MNMSKKLINNVINDKVAPLFIGVDKLFVYVDEGGMFGVPNYILQNQEIDINEYHDFIGEFSLLDITAYLQKRFSEWIEQGYKKEMIENISFELKPINDEFFLKLLKTKQYEAFQQFHDLWDGAVLDAVSSKPFNSGLFATYFNSTGRDFMCYAVEETCKENILNTLNL